MKTIELLRIQLIKLNSNIAQLKDVQNKMLNYYLIKNQKLLNVEVTSIGEMLQIDEISQNEENRFLKSKVSIDIEPIPIEYIPEFLNLNIIDQFVELIDIDNNQENIKKISLKNAYCLKYKTIFSPLFSSNNKQLISEMLFNVFSLKETFFKLLSNDIQFKYETEVEGKRIQLCKEFCEKDENNNPIFKEIDNNQLSFTIKDKSLFDIKLNELFEQNEELINNYTKWLESETELNITPISFELIPDDVNGYQLELISTLSQSI